MTAELLSARLQLSPLTLEDGQALRGNARVLSGMHRLPKLVDAWVADLLAGEPGEMTWAVAPRGSQPLSGCMGMVNVSLDADEAELSCWVSRAQRRRGYASEALECLVGHLFEQASMKRLRGSCYRSNRAAARVLEKSGMRLIGELTGLSRAEGRSEDLLLYALDRDDWQARRLGLEPLSPPG